MTTPSTSLVPLKISPCSNCGSTSWTQRADGEYVRGCCTENGDHRPTFEVDATYENAMKTTKTRYRVASNHPAYGIEGARIYEGTERGAKRVAAAIARRAGFGWRPFVSRLAVALLLLATTTVHAAAAKPSQSASEGIKTAVCNDGKTLYTPTGEHRGACSGHGGVASWANGQPVHAKGGSRNRYE